MPNVFRKKKKTLDLLVQLSNCRGASRAGGSDRFPALIKNHLFGERLLLTRRLKLNPLYWAKINVDLDPGCDNSPV